MDLLQYQGPFNSHEAKLRAARCHRRAEKLGYENIEPLPNGNILAETCGFIYALKWDDENNQLARVDCERLAANPCIPEPKVAA